MMLCDGGCVCGPQVRREKASLWGERKWTQLNICPSVLMIASLPVFLVCDDPMTGSLPCDITDLKAQQQQSEHHLIRVITAR